MILGIDTSLGTATAAVTADGEIVAEAASADPRGHDEAIGPLLGRVLAGPVTHVAAGMGPGPFTGLRIGIAAARAFALGRGIPVIPVVSHDAVALEILLADQLRDAATPRFAVVTDARRREFAMTVYDGVDDDGLPVREAAPQLVPRDDLDARLAALGAARRDAASVSAAMLALVAARALGAGRTVSPAEPLYLRPPDVTLPHGPKRVSA